MAISNDNERWPPSLETFEKELMDELVEW